MTKTTETPCTGETNEMFLGVVMFSVGMVIAASVLNIASPDVLAPDARVLGIGGLVILSLAIAAKGWM